MKKIKYLLLAALMTISVGTQAQNIFPATITALSEFNDSMIVRIAEIEVYPQYLAEYLAYANEVDRLSVELEPGVICLFPMQSAEGSLPATPEDRPFPEVQAGHVAYGEESEPPHHAAVGPWDDEANIQEAKINN